MIMIISTITIICASIGVATGLIGGGAIGYAIGNRRRRDNIIDEYFETIFTNYEEQSEEDETIY